jgi:hypothetical protein
MPGTICAHLKMFPVAPTARKAESIVRTDGLQIADVIGAFDGQGIDGDKFVVKALAIFHLDDTD